MAATFGELVRGARQSAGISLKSAGDAVGVSAPYLHDVEHNRRRLAPRWWPALVAAIPALTIRALAEAAVASGPVEVDARDLTPEQRARAVDALELAARAA